MPNINTPFEQVYFSYPTGDEEIDKKKIEEMLKLAKEANEDQFWLYLVGIFADIEDEAQARDAVEKIQSMEQKIEAVEIYNETFDPENAPVLT